MKCLICGDEFETPALYMTHKDVKQYQSAFCGWQFRSKFCLIKHERTNTGQKPFACGKCFISKEN